MAQTLAAGGSQRTSMEQRTDTRWPWLVPIAIAVVLGAVTVSGISHMVSGPHAGIHSMAEPGDEIAQFGD